MAGGRSAATSLPAADGRAGPESRRPTLARAPGPEPRAAEPRYDCWAHDAQDHPPVPDVPLPAYATAGAAAFDLAAAADVEVPPHAHRRSCPTGLVIEVPAGHFLAILARSSTPLKRGLMVANGVGVVDSRLLRPGRRSEDPGHQRHRRAGARRRAATASRRRMVLAAPRVDVRGGGRRRPPRAADSAAPAAELPAGRLRPSRTPR